MKKEKYVLFAFLTAMFLSGQVFAQDAAGTVSPPPLSYSNISATNITATSARITWVTNIPTASSYVTGVLSQSQTSPSFTLDASCNGSTGIESTNHCILLQNITPNTNYYYKITTNVSNDPVVSEWKNIRTLSAPQPSSPENPTNVLLVNPNDASVPSIKISWNDNSSTETNFKIRRTIGEHAMSPVSFNINQNITNYTDTSVVVGTSYNYTVQACNGSTLCSAPDFPVTLIANSVTVTAPSNVVSRIETGSSVRVSWNDNSNNEINFKIRRTKVSGPTTDTTREFLTTGANVSSYIDTTAIVGNTYRYSVKSCRTASFCSTYISNISNISIPVVNVAIVAPSVPVSMTTVLQTSSNPRNVLVSWVDTSSDETTFKITRTSNLDTSGKDFDVTSNVTSYTDTTVSTSTTNDVIYTYSIKACKDSFCSSASPVSSVTVPRLHDVAPMITANFNPTSIQTTESSVFSFSSINASTCSYSYNGNPVPGQTQTTNSMTIAGSNYPSGLTIMVTCYAPGGLFTSISKTLTVAQPAVVTTTPVDISFSVNGRSVINNDVIQLTSNDVSFAWSGTGASDCFFDGNSWTSFGNKTITGVTAGPHTFSCRNTSNSKSISFTVNLPVTSSVTTGTNETGGTQTQESSSSTVSIGFSDSPVATSSPVVLLPPIKPSGMIITKISRDGLLSNSFRISWTDTSDNETSFKMYKNSPNGGSEITGITENTTFYDDNSENIKPGLYTYYLAACNNQGCSSVISSIATIELPIIKEEPVVSTEISKAVGLVLPGSFINLIITGVTDGSQGTLYTAEATKDGTFAINVPDGKYILEIVSPGAETKTKELTLSFGKVTSLTDKIITTVKKITGKVSFTQGSPVADAEVSAYKKETNKWLNSFTDANGNYSINVESGNWELTARPRSPSSATWSEPVASSVSFSNQNINETRESYFTVTPINSNLTVKVINEAGDPIPDVSVTVDSLSNNASANLNTSSDRIIQVDKTGSNGGTVSYIPKGIYFIRVSAPSATQYLSSGEQSVFVNQGESKTFIVTLKKEKIAEITKITGITRFSDGEVTTAFVSAWSDQGGYTQAQSSPTGFFTLDLLKNQTWHIRATKDLFGKSYISTERVLNTTVSQKIEDIIFVRNSAVVLPPPVVEKKYANEQVTVLSNDGARFSLPPNAVTGSGKIDVEMKATVEASGRAASSLLSTAYDITIKNTSGEELSKLTSDAEILLPYDEEDMKAKGVSLENIIPSYYDESTNIWIPVTKFTINKEKKVFVLRVDHLTRFALIAAADTTAPSAPTNIVTDAITPTDVKISWENPSNDFNHSKVYRSETLGSFGTLVASEVFSNSFIDKLATAGKTYYYTIRAVDAAGNESNNNNAIAFTFKDIQIANVVNNQSTSLLLPPGQAPVSEITRILSIGNKGDDVTLLQKALKLDGFYATGPITGYFGKLTQNAVFRFQNYYKEELLIPNGFKKGTGMVGPATRKKINEILATSGQ